MIPVIDLFAGPGGLCEGFSRPLGGGHPFLPVLSIEKDATAHRTLELRAFVHYFVFHDEPLPEEYYRYLRKEIERDILFAAHPAAAMYAKKTAWLATLGGNEVSEAEFDRRIRERLGGERNWVLIGGPPCQAYSLAGRSRKIGGYKSQDHLSLEEALNEFSKDEKQTLYKQYLRILAVHKPAVFVMENVAGILSAQVHGEKIFPKIVSDLTRPEAAVVEDWPELKGDGRRRYRIFSFVTGNRPENGAERDYLICAEKYGIPQARHRVILLGVRADFHRGLSAIHALEETDATTISQVIGDLPKMRSRISKGGEDSSENWVRLLKEAAKNPSFAYYGMGGVQEAMRRAESARECVLSYSETEKRDTLMQLPAALREWLVDDRLMLPLNHNPRAHMVSDLPRYLFVSAFGAAKGRSPVLADFPESLLPAHKNVNKNGDKGHQAFADRFKVQLANCPSSTITCHIAKDGHHFIHYDVAQCRSLTVREAARLQTFPDNYFFEGNQTEQYHQVGNAVPPFLAAQLADIVFSLFRTARQRGTSARHPER